MAQITIEEGVYLYREIHAENQLTDAEGQTSSLKPGCNSGSGHRCDDKETSIVSEAAHEVTS
jgi:hypothetical protein